MDKPLGRLGICKKEIQSILTNDIAVNDKPRDYLIVDYQGFPNLAELERYSIEELVTLATIISDYGLGVDWLIENYSDRYSFAELQKKLDENYIGAFSNYGEYGEEIFEKISGLSVEEVTKMGLNNFVDYKKLGQYHWEDKVEVCSEGEYHLFEDDF